MKRNVSLTAVCFAALALSVFSNGFQQADAQTRSSRSKASATETKKPTRRLPRFYGQIGLEEKQREEIYGIQADYKKDIDELEEQLAELRADMKKDIEDVLTDDQLDKLEDLVDASSKKSSSRSSRSTKSSDAEDK